MRILDYRELRVYQEAFEAALSVHEVSAGFPVVERFGLTDQVRRASRSVCANLAEAWRRRRSSKHFVSKLSDSDAEAAEVGVWLDFALRFGYMSVEQHAKLNRIYDGVNRQLTVMIRFPEQWTITDR